MMACPDTPTVIMGVRVVALALVQNREDYAAPPPPPQTTETHPSRIVESYPISASSSDCCMAKIQPKPTHHEPFYRTLPKYRRRYK